MIADEAALKELMLKGLAGDEVAHRTFLTRVAGYIRAYLRGRMASAPDDVEDLLQEVLIALHTRRDAYDPAFPVTAWVYAITRYRMIDHFRRTKRRGVQIPVEDADGLFARSEDEASDAKRDVGRLLGRLPHKQREAIRLTKLEEYSVREASEALGISESDVKISVFRGLKALTALIAQPPHRSDP